MNRTAFDPGPLAEVSYNAEGDRWTLVFVRTLRHSPDRVWDALTDPGQLSGWAPYISDRDLGQTGAATLTMIDGNEQMELHANVTRADPPSLLEYSWGSDELRWELAAEGEGTRLTLRHTIDDEDFVPKIAAGWHLCLVVAERLLDGNPIEPIRGDDAKNYGWGELSDAYADELDIDTEPGD
jgi:uncharacterized protein YndB with AHSA1/START domain